MFCLCVNVSNWFFSAPYNKQIYAFSEKMKSPIHEYTLMKWLTIFLKKSWQDFSVSKNENFANVFIFTQPNL